MCLISLGHTIRSGISGSYGNSVFNILGNRPTVFQSSCTFLLSLQEHPPQHVLASDFLIPVILVGVKWCLFVVLICMSQRVNDAVHLLICLSVICVSF